MCSPRATTRGCPYGVVATRESTYICDVHPWINGRTFRLDNDERVSDNHRLPMGNAARQATRGRRIAVSYHAIRRPV